MNVKSRVETVRALLAEVTAQATEAEARLTDLRAEQRGLELSLARLTSEATQGNTFAADKVETETPSFPSQRGSDFPAHAETWQQLGKTNAVKRVLEQATKPLAPADIVDVLGSVGLPQRDSESVRGALAYLKRKGKAIPIGRSQWVLINGAVYQRLQGERPEGAPAQTGTPSAPVHPEMKGGAASGTGKDSVHDLYSLR